MKIRAATKDDLIEMVGQTFPENIRAVTAEHDGELLAIAGIRMSNPKVIFSDIKPEVKKHPRVVVQLIHKVQAMMEDYNTEIYAIANENEPTAPGLLNHMGFKHVMTTRQGEVYQWLQ